MEDEVLVAVAAASLSFIQALIMARELQISKL
jgi:hypothetical protein